MGLDGCLCRQVNTHAHQSGLGTGLGEVQGGEEAPKGVSDPSLRRGFLGRGWLSWTLKGKEGVGQER